MFPDSQDHFGEVQPQRPQGVVQEQGLPPESEFLGKLHQYRLFKIVQDDHDGHFKVFPDSQDHLGEVQPQRPQGVVQEQGLPPESEFLGKLHQYRLFKIVQDDHDGHFKVFPDSQDHLGEVQPQRPQGAGQEQGLPQRVNLWNKLH